MLNTQEIQGRWNQLKGQVKERWGQLTDDDLQFVSGNVDQLIGRIQQRTGEQRQVIENVFNDLLEGGEKTGAAIHQAKQAATGFAQEAAHRVREGVGQAQEKVREGFDEARDVVQEGYDQTRRQVREGVRRAERAVHDRPAESVATLFGLGLLAGVITGIFLHSDA